MLKEFWLTLTPWKKFRFVIAILLLIYVVIFAVINWNSHELNFLFFHLNLPITLLIALCLAIGYFCSSLFDYKKYKAKELEILKLKLKIEELEAKL